MKQKIGPGASVPRPADASEIAGSSEPADFKQRQDAGVAAVVESRTAAEAEKGLGRPCTVERKSGPAASAPRPTDASERAGSSDLADLKQCKGAEAPPCLNQ